MPASSAGDARLDRHGHLKDTTSWTEQIAGELAADEQLELTEQRLRICRCLRLFHHRFGTDPTHRALARFIAAEMGDEWADSSFLAIQFPGGFLRQASRLAGLPLPSHCL